MQKNNQDSKNLDSLNPLQQIFLKAKDMKSQGYDIIELGIGDPDSETPARVKRAAVNAVHNHCNYIPPSGSMELKEAIVKKYKKNNCLIKTAEVVASGGSFIVIDKLFQVLLSKGDIVILPAPYYPPFLGIIKAYGGVAHAMDTRNNDFKLSAAIVEGHILSLAKNKKHPKALIINSPNNPTGAEYDKQELIKIARLAEKHKFIIISDECYGNFSKNKNFTFKSIYPKAIVVNSCSKTYAMTGYRVGWGLMPVDIAKRVSLKLSLHINSFSSISEKAAIAALRGAGVPDFKEQRKYILNWAKTLGITGNDSGQAAFYLFADFSKFYKKLKVNSSLEFAEQILERAKVSVAPGSAFGDYDDYVRISYCVKMEVLKRALEKIGKILED